MSTAADTAPAGAPGTPRFETVLVANRGEIARRVIRTLRDLGIRSVAVYSDADAAAPHVREADAAVRIGPAAASASYLDIGAVIGAAVASGADAVHPGYGFLSENAAFARACADAGIVFIGPSAEALAIMGDKIRAKEHVSRHGVPVVPGFSAAGMTDAEIAERARATGYPLLVKPSAGGGGKGMQVVRVEAELPEALRTARRIAAAAFADDTLLLERLIERPRHIEVQVLADEHGAVVHLGERECTLQRRHQKVVEEAPSPAVDPATRARLGEAACAAAASVDYRGAGTVEFLVSAERPDEFFFIEMNTRLQVEHPVTEQITGVDLVAQQVRIAEGQPLPFGQDEITLTGHAVEARVYAETPERGFLPATGDVLLFRPAPGARTDAAVVTGSTVTADYDPMIAKVIVHSDDRAGALARLDAALAETIVLGVDTNIRFLRTLLAEEGVRSGDMDTGLIERMPQPEAPVPEPSALQAAARLARAGAEVAAGRGQDDGAPSRRRGAGPVWHEIPGWRVGGRRALAPTLLEDDRGTLHRIAADPSVADPHDAVTASASDGAIWVHLGGETVRLRPVARRDAMRRRLAAAVRTDTATDPDVRAPMPGAVVWIHVASGERVEAGARIATIEAMKMEHPVLAPHSGTVTVDVAAGEQVRRDQTIARVTADPASDTRTETTAAWIPGAHEATEAGSATQEESTWTATS